MRCLVCCVGLCLGGCFATRVDFGRPAGQHPIEYQDAWNHNLFWSLWNFSDPHDLDAICPDGVAELRSETRVFNGLVGMLSNYAYTPQTVNIVCAAPEAEEITPRPSSPRTTP